MQPAPVKNIKTPITSNIYVIPADWKIVNVRIHYVYNNKHCRNQRPKKCMK